MTRRAFTLAEVLAALVLAGVVLPVALRGISSSMRASGDARRVAEASELAHLKLSELSLLRDSSLFTGSGTFGAAWPEYRWESRFTTNSVGAYEVNVDVLWMDREQVRSVSLATLVYISEGVSQ